MCYKGRLQEEWALSDESWEQNSAGLCIFSYAVVESVKALNVSVVRHIVSTLH